MRKTALGVIVFCLVLFFIVKDTPANESYFSDLPNKHWANKAIMSLAQTGIITGFPDRTFQPDSKVTREQFAVVLVSALKLPIDSKASQTFSDVKPNNWAFYYIDAAKSYLPSDAGFDKGLLFNGRKPILRQEVAAAVVMAKGYEKTQPVNLIKLKDEIKDYNNINDNFKNYVALAVQNKIMFGNKDGLFRAEDEITRAELSVIMFNMIYGEKVDAIHELYSITFNNTQSRQDSDGNEHIFTGTVETIVYNPIESYIVVSSGTTSLSVYTRPIDTTFYFIGDQLQIKYINTNEFTSLTVLSSPNMYPFSLDSNGFPIVGLDGRPIRYTGPIKPIEVYKDEAVEAAKKRLEERILEADLSFRLPEYEYRTQTGVVEYVYEEYFRLENVERLFNKKGIYNRSVVEVKVGDTVEVTIEYRSTYPFVAYVRILK